MVKGEDKKRRKKKEKLVTREKGGKVRGNRDGENQRKTKDGAA